MALEARDVRVHFDGVRAIDGVDLTLSRGEILGLIGPNGAGKTTLINVLSGFQRPTTGSVLAGHIDVTGWPPHEIALIGLVRTFQAVRPFRELSVFENVEAAALAGGLSRKDARGLAWDTLSRLRLTPVAYRPAKSLPHGEERRLGIGRALAARPVFLLLDEPGAGLNESESDNLVEALTAIRADYNIGLLVIEHDMRLIMSLCERIQVLDHGKTIAVGPPGRVRADPAVIEAYLGAESESHAAS